MMTIRINVAILASLATVVGLTGPLTPAEAQNGGRYPASHAIYQTAQPGRTQASAQRAQLIDAHGDPAVIPAQYGEPYGGGYYEDPNVAYGGVSLGIDQVGPHYFDFAMEYVSLQRDDIIRGGIGFTADDFVPVGFAPNLVLTSDSLEGRYQPGFRVTGRFDIGPMGVLEGSYTGHFDMDDEATIIDAEGDLFSPFTNFGSGFNIPNLVTPDPDDTINVLQGGFDPDNLEDFEETDRASLHSIAYTSDLQSAELSFRRYWVGFSPRVTGTLLAGFRYTDLRESFQFNTVGNNFDPQPNGDPPTSVSNDPNMPDGVGTAQLLISGDNNLTGFQTGGDVWVGIVQGLRFGAEGKVGIYNNRYELTSIFSTSDGDPVIFETTKNNHAAFISEAKLMLVADLLPSMSVKGGYEVLFINSLALVGENINTGSPYDNPNIDAAGATRVPFVRDQGHAYYHGWNIGFEYIW